jgi:hypothetical protein
MQWLLDSAPSIRRQVMRDLTGRRGVESRLGFDDARPHAPA